MNCEQALSLISARLDREIAPEDAAALDRHLNECPACRAAAEAFALQDHELRQAFEPRRAAAAEVARSVAGQLAPPTPFPRPWLPIAIVGGTLLAACLAGVFLYRLFVDMGPRPNPNGPSNSQFADPSWLTPKTLTRPPEPDKLAVGASVKTGPAQRQRVQLPDKSILYVDRDTVATVKTERTVHVERGNVYVEVAPDSQNRFTIETPSREVVAHGTRFEVQVGKEGTGVVVTQGKVKVSDVGDYLVAGQQLLPGAQKVEAAPRTSYLLDWTRELMDQASAALLPPSQHAGGSLIAYDSSGQEAKLSLRKYSIDVHIEDGFARTTIDQTYFNHHPWRLEGTFNFPLPPDASLSQLTMYVNGERQEGGMVERQQGRAIYQKIVNGMRDPALLEWVDGTTFKMRVFPLEGRQEKRILLSYTQRLPVLYGRATYRFPAGHSLQVVRDWTFNARIKDGKNTTVICPTHSRMQGKVAGGDLLLSAEEHDVKVDRDVVLYLPQGPEAVRGESVEFRHADHGGFRYSMTRFRPELPTTATRQRRDWVFLYEASADRDPLLARVQIEVIRNLLTQAEHDDRFFVIAANSRVHLFETFGSLATADNIQRAIDWLGNVHLVGALDLGGAFDTASKLAGGLENPHVVHLGSGHPGMGRKQDALKEMIAKEMPKAKYVGIGVGKRWARAFMKEQAEKTGGLFTQINPDEQVAWRTFELLATLNTPRLLNVTAEFPGKDMPRVLVDQALLSQGEELCITTRVPLVDGKANLPAQLVVKGTLDGKDYRKVIALEPGPGGAGYLPRTWARLEIDRLLAADARANKDEIIDLSKESYVMTPYTSLLVLENEAMYKEFKVEQGRKDHWAAFAAPDKIPVVYEPDPTQIGDTRNAPQDRKPSKPEILSTILLHVPARFLRTENEGQSGQVLTTALEVYRGAFMEPLTMDDTASVRLREGREWKDDDKKESDVRELLEDSRLGRAPVLSNSAFRVENGEPPIFYASSSMPKARNELKYLAGIRDGESNTLLLARNDIYRRSGNRGRGTQGVTWAEAGGRSALGDDNTPMLLGLDAPSDGAVAATVPAMNYFPTSFGMMVNGRARLAPQGESPVQLWSAVEAERAKDHFFAQPRGLIDGDFDEYGVAEGFGRRRGAGGAMHYERLVATGDRRLRDDLIGYAPGLNTSTADILAILEAEAEPELRNVPGHISPAALALIDAARKGGWMRLEPSDKDAEKDPPRGTLRFDASGRFVAERMTPVGLREETICNGDTILSLYTEIGLVGRRTTNRYHRAELVAALPHVVAPASDLARGHDLEVVTPRTVALIPHNVGDKKHLRQHLVFAEDGKLAERQWVLIPGKKDTKGEKDPEAKPKVLLRQILSANGVVVMALVKEGEKEDEKEVSRVSFKLTPVEAPSLDRDLAPLVVLELPLRNRDTMFRNFKLSPNENLDNGANGGYRHLPHQDAVQLLAMLCLTRHPDLHRVMQNCFLERDDLRPGLLVLLAASGMEVGQQDWFLRFVEANAGSSVVRYFGVLHNPLYRQFRTTFPGELTRGVGPAGSFLRRLARFHELFDRWQTRGLVWDLTRREHMAEALAFIAEDRESILSRTMLVRMQAHNQLLADDWVTLAEQWRKLKESGDYYRSQYERASCLRTAAGQYEEIDEFSAIALYTEARETFLDVANWALKKDMLPPLDGRFYNAVREPGPKDPWTQWVQATTEDLLKEDPKKKKAPLAVLKLANRCRELGDPALAENLIVRVLQGLDEKERIGVTAAVVVRLLDWNQPDMAEVHLQTLLAEVSRVLAQEKGKKDPKVKPSDTAWVYRLAGRVVDARSQTARKFEYLEVALELEAQDLPDVLPLEAWRQDYRPLMDYYVERARILADLGTQADVKAREDLIRRTVRTIDRFRAHDPESGNECQKAGQVLRLLGAEDLAWDYLTTPSAGKEEAPSLHGEALNLARAGAIDLAERTFRVACEADPESADIWWDRAQALRQAGRTAEATALFQALADGKINKEEQVYRQRATWLLRQR
jgi:ferric-dicitrate binding protein FerR (iron transport regulator)